MLPVTPVASVHLPITSVKRHCCPLATLEAAINPANGREATFEEVIDARQARLAETLSGTIMLDRTAVVEKITANRKRRLRAKQD